MSKEKILFTKVARLRTKAEFEQVMKRGNRHAGEYIIVHSLSKRDSRLGISVSRQYGKAHERNRFKRIVREAFKQTLPSLNKPLHLNIKPRNLAKQATSHDIARELRLLLT